MLNCAQMALDLVERTKTRSQASISCPTCHGAVMAEFLIDALTHKLGPTRRFLCLNISCRQMPFYPEVKS